MKARMLLLVTVATVVALSKAEEPLKGLAEKLKNDESILGDFARVYNQMDLLT